jgi:hypothetical protein
VVDKVGRVKHKEQYVRELIKNGKAWYKVEIEKSRVEKEARITAAQAASAAVAALTAATAALTAAAGPIAETAAIAETA